MKKKILLILMAFIAFVAFTSEIESGTGIAGRTSSPGETNCTGCHADFALNTGGGTVSVTSTMTNCTYALGQTYTINVKVKHTGSTIFGMDFEALCGSTIANAGTMVVTNSAKTQIKTKTVSSVVRNNMVHTSNGGLSNDSAVFTFNWTAPATESGIVTFYFAGIAGDNDAGTGGDYVYTSTQIIQSPLTASVNTPVASNHLLSVFPNPVKDVLNISFYNSKSGMVKASIYSIIGLRTADLFNENMNTGIIEKHIPVSGGWAKGTYFLVIERGENKSIERLLIQ